MDAGMMHRKTVEALLVDSRITSVTDFEHDLSVKGTVHVTFIVHTIFGDIQEEKGVNI